MYIINKAQIICVNKLFMLRTNGNTREQLKSAQVKFINCHDGDIEH